MAFAPTAPGACSVYLECTSGIGDLISDAAAGVTIALERGCVRPTVRTRWQHASRHYEWPALVASELFTMESALPALGHSCCCTSCSSPRHIHINGGPWPPAFYNASEQRGLPTSRRDIVVVPFPHATTPNGTCGAHANLRWLAPLAGPHVPPQTLLDRFATVFRSVRLQHSSLPANIAQKAVIHFRRGDKLLQDESRLGVAKGQRATLNALRTPQAHSSLMRRQTAVMVLIAQT